MSDLITVTGNITAPPTRQETGGGVPMVTFGLASTERRVENGAWIDGHTNFYNVSVFRSLAENAYASLEKGQRIIVTGRIRVRRWEANGRTGTSVDLEATSVGPDLLFGVATFVKNGQPSRVSAPHDGSPHDGTPQGETPQWATAPAGGENAGGTGGEPAGGSAGVPSGTDEAPAAGRTAPQLITAGGWGAPPVDEDATPF